MEISSSEHGYKITWRADLGRHLVPESRLSRLERRPRTHAEVLLFPASIPLLRGCQVRRYVQYAWTVPSNSLDTEHHFMSSKIAPVRLRTVANHLQNQQQGMDSITPVATEVGAATPVTVDNEIKGRLALVTGASGGYVHQLWLMKAQANFVPVSVQAAHATSSNTEHP